MPEFAILSRPSPNCWVDSTPIKAIVLHATADQVSDRSQLSASSSVGWLRNSKSDASADYVIDVDGTIYCLVSPYENKRAWANGIVTNPDTSIAWLQDCIKNNVNPNLCTISIEHVAASSDMVAHNTNAMPDIQMQASLWLVNKLLTDFKLTASDQTLIGHCQIDSVSRANCPGVISIPDYIKKVQAMTQQNNSTQTNTVNDPVAWHCLETDKWVTNDQGFLTFWRNNGGLPIFGYPITGARLQVGSNDIVEQYFQRARLEYHVSAKQIMLGLVGAELLAKLPQ